MTATVTDLFCGAGGSSLYHEICHRVEIAAAMAFPTGYIPRALPKKDQVKLAGNAVTPPVMAWIVGRILQALEAAS